LKDEIEKNKNKNKIELLESEIEKTILN